MRLSNSFAGYLFLVDSYLQTFPLWEQGCRRPTSPTPQTTFDALVVRQASSPSLCASVRALPWADEAEQQISRLALSGYDLSADIRILGAGLPGSPAPKPKYTFEF